MKTLTIVLAMVIGLPAPGLAQGPLAAQARAAAVALELERAGDPGLVVLRTDMEHPTLFWIGVGLLAGGVLAMVAAVTWDQESDLSNEYRTTRLGTDLAPCGTDPIDTLLPIAECKVNTGLLWVGGGLTTIGGGLMVYGGQRVQHVRPAPPGIRMTLRF